MPKQTLILDSTQIDSFYECPSLWNFRFRENLTASEAEEKDAIAMGTLGHKWMERYYTLKALGKSIPECIVYANAFDPDVEDVNDNHIYPLDKDKRKKVIDRCQHYWMTYSIQDFNVDSARDYAIDVDFAGMPVDVWRNRPLVEQGFSYKLFESPEYLFILEGKIDVIASQGGNTLFVDHKFQLRERRLYNKSIQFRNYAMVTGLHLGIINYIRLHESISNKTFVREPVSFNSYELLQWRHELIDKYVEIAQMVKKNWYNKNRAACSGKFGYPCEFTKICEEPNVVTGNLVKLSAYKQKKEWRPW